MIMMGWVGVFRFFNSEHRDGRLRFGYIIFQFFLLYKVTASFFLFVDYFEQKTDLTQNVVDIKSSTIRATELLGRSFCL